MEEIVLEKYFYETLYDKKNNSNITNKLLFRNANYQTARKWIYCEGILSEYECKNALDQMSSNKSPWSDGQLNSTKHSGTK